MIATEEGIPEYYDNDDDDVAWALQTASVEWKREAYSDAISWLRRAVDYAIEAGHSPRASELNGVAGRLAEAVQSEGPARRAFDRDSDDDITRDSDDDITRDSDDDIIRENDLVVEVAPESPSPRHASGGRSKSSVDAESDLPELPSEPPPPSRVVDSQLPRRKSRDIDIPDGAVIGGGADALAVAAIGATDEDAQQGAASQQPASAPSAGDVESDPSAADSEREPESSDSEDDLLPDLDEADDEMTNLDAVPSDSESLLPPPELPNLDDAELGAPNLPDFDDDVEASGDQAASLGAGVSSDELAELPTEAGATAEPAVLGVRLSSVRGFEDLPEDAQTGLAANAKLEALQPDEELSFFAVGLVVKGDVSIVPAVSDIPCGYAGKGDVIFTKGNLEDGVELSVAAGPDGAAVAVWSQEVLEAATEECPWVADELRQVADHFQAMAGATMGPLGERLDESLLASVLAKCEVRLYLDGDVVIEADAPVQGLFVVGAGRLMVGAQEIGPGDLLFPTCTLSNSPAPMRAAAGDGGALVLHLGSHETHEMMMMVPPLLEILSMA